MFYDIFVFRMETIEEFKNHYSRLSSSKLIELIKDAKDLRSELIPILHAELIKRNMTAEAESLIELTKPDAPKINYKEYSGDEILKMINERIKNGESLENIKDDLKTHDIDIFDYINEDARIKADAMNYLTELINEDVEPEVIKDKMKTTFLIDNSELVKLKAELKGKGKNNLLFGFILLFAFIIIISTSIIIPEFVYLLLGLGLWFIFRGSMQLKR